MVDTCVSGAYGEIHAGSSPAFGTIKEPMIFIVGSFILAKGRRTPPNEVSLM